MENQSGSNAGKLYHYFTSPRAVVEIDQDDLLPGSQEQPAAGKWDHQRWADQGSPDVGAAVVISPPEMVAVGAVGGRDLIQHALQVGDHPILELDGRQPGGGAGAEQGYRARIQLSFGYRSLNERGDVDGVGVPLRPQVQLACDDHGFC